MVDHSDVAKVLDLPDTCFYLTVGSKVLRDYMSLAAEGVGSGSVIRVCAENARENATGQWRFWWRLALVVAVTLGSGHARTRSARAKRCWPTKSKCFRCGAPKGCGLTQDLGKPPCPPGEARSGATTVLHPPCLAAKAARREAAAFRLSPGYCTHSCPS